MSNPIYLSPRQIEVLACIAHGDDNKTIARKLCIKGSSVRSHINQIYLKIGTSNRVQAALWTLRAGLVKLDEVRP